MQQSLFVVDDEEVMRDALKSVFALEGYDVHCYESGAQFLSAVFARNAACVILDAQMPPLSGLDVLRILREQNYAVPVIMMSGRADIRTAVEAMRNGAFDFVEKPFDALHLVSRVKEAIAFRPGAQSAGSSVYESILTPRERDVLNLITEGASNKEAGRRLSISPRTIEVHRARIMEKLGARNAADLVRIVLRGSRTELKPALLGSRA